MTLAGVGLAWLRASAFPQAVGLAVPVLVRAMLAFGLGAVMAAAGHSPAAFTVSGALGEILMGMGLGLCLRLPLVAVQSAGEVMGHNTNAANLMSPGVQDSSAGSGWQGAYNWLGLLVYLGVGGPQALVQALAGSTRLVPLGRVALGLGGLGIADLSPLVARTAALALVLCLPPVLASLLAQWGLGLVFRASARMHLFGFAMPLASLAAAGALALALPSWPALLGRSLGWSLQAASGFASGMGGR